MAFFAPRAQLEGFVLSATESPPIQVGRCLVELADNGSAIWARINSLVADRLSVVIGDNTATVFPWHAVKRLTVRSSRMVFLSDLMFKLRHQFMIRPKTRTATRQTNDVSRPKARMLS